MFESDGGRSVEASLACDLASVPHVSSIHACYRLASRRARRQQPMHPSQTRQGRSRTGAHRNELGCAGACIDGCGPGADALGGEHQQGRRDIVLRDDQEAITRPQTQRGKSRAEPIDGSRGGGEVDRASSVAIGRSRRRLTRVLEQPIRDDHCRAAPEFAQRLLANLAVGGQRQFLDADDMLRTLVGRQPRPCEFDQLGRLDRNGAFRRRRRYPPRQTRPAHRRLPRDALRDAPRAAARLQADKR